MRWMVWVVVLLAGVKELQAQEKGRVGSIGTGWTYPYSDQGAGERESISGWYLRPSVRIAKGLSVYGHLTVYYGANRKGSLNSHGLRVGLSRAFFRDAKVAERACAGGVCLRAEAESPAGVHRAQDDNPGTETVAAFGC